MTPLRGLTVVVTREKSQAAELQSRLESLGARVHLFPLLEFAPPDEPRPREEAMERVESYDWIVFTSRNAVRHFRVPGLRQPRVAAIGPGTREALSDQGVHVDLVAATSVAEGLLEAFAGHNLEGKSILLPRAQEARDLLPDGLRGRGAHVDVVAVYKTIRAAPSEPCPEADWVILMSGSSATRWRELCPGDPACLCIGPITAGTARELGFTRVTQADHYDLEGVVQKLLEVAGQG